MAPPPRPPLRPRPVSPRQVQGLIAGIAIGDCSPDGPGTLLRKLRFHFSQSPSRIFGIDLAAFGRIDDPNAGWKGRGVWTTSGDRAPWLKEGGKGTVPIAFHFQLRPNPLADSRRKPLGRAINPLIHLGWAHGGIAQGVGQALLADRYYERQQLPTASFMDYGMPRADTLPFLATARREVPAPTNRL